MSTSNIVSIRPLPKTKVVIPKAVMNKLTHWVQRGGSHECSGMGKVIVQGSTITVVDAWMVKQANSASTTEMDADHLATLLYQTREVPGRMSFWWHSHANMSVFWSGTDTDQIAKLADNGLCVALVMNLKGERRACVAVGGEGVPTIHVDQVDVEVPDPLDESLLASWNAEYDGCVEKKTYGGTYLTDRTYSNSTISRGRTSRWNDQDDDYYLGGLWRSESDVSEEETSKDVPSTPADGILTPSSLREYLDRLEYQEQALQDALNEQTPMTREVCNLIGVQWNKDITVHWTLEKKPITEIIQLRLELIDKQITDAISAYKAAEKKELEETK